MSEVKQGDKVTRLLAGTIPQVLTVTEVTEDRIICGGGYQFHREFGYEIDEDIGWGIKDEQGRVHTGSYLKLGAVGIEVVE